MNVSLTPKLERLVQKKVKSGLYNSASEVVRESLRLLEDRDRVREARLRDLRKEVAEGLRALGSGRYKEYDDRSLKAMFDDLKARWRQGLSRRRKTG